MKTILIIFCFLLFWIKSYGQESVTFCDNQYGSELLKVSKQVFDSLRNAGIDSLINYNHYSAGFGYSKTLWASGNAIYQIQIVEKRTEKNEIRKTRELRILNSREMFDLLNFRTLEAKSGGLKECTGFMSHQPYHLLYLYINAQESCISVAENQVKCNTENGKVKLIKELTMRPEEYYKLVVNRDEKKN